MTLFILGVIQAVLAGVKTFGIINPAIGTVATDADVLLQIALVAKKKYEDLQGQPVDWSTLHEIEPIP